MTIRFFKNIAAVALLLVHYAVAGQDTISLAARKPFTVNDCVSFALENNISVRKQNLVILQSQMKVQETRAAALPQVNAALQATDNLLIAQQLIPGEIFGQPGSFIPVKFGVQYAIPARLEASQMVYNKQYQMGLESAKAAALLADVNNVKIREDVAYNVASSFYSALITNKQRELIEANLFKLNQAVKVAQVQYDNKMIRRIDVEQLQVNESNTQSELDNITLGYTQSVDMLKILMGFPLADTLILATELPVNEEFTLPSNGVAANPLLALQDGQMTLKKLEMQTIRSQYYPTVSLFSNASYQAQFNKLDNINWIPSLAVGVSVNMPLFDGFRKKYQTQQREIDVKSLSLDRQLTSDQLNVQYQNAVRKYQQNLRTAKSQQTNLDLAQNVYAAVQTNYKNGIATLSDMINAESSLRGAQTQYLSAQLQVRLASLEILRANGSVSTTLGAK